ncbi:hypothetical protein BH18VER1_BH18VER1_20750 [soil metagenome]
MIGPAPGAYTAVVTGADNTTGIALVEVYDMQVSASSKLANISTRGVVGTGANVMIGGTIVTGPDPARILFRAIGQSLASAGIANPLANPQLELFNNNGTRLAANDNWRTAEERAPRLEAGFAKVIPSSFWRNDFFEERLHP